MRCNIKKCASFGQGGLPPIALLLLMTMCVSQALTLIFKPRMGAPTVPMCFCYSPTAAPTSRPTPGPTGFAAALVTQNTSQAFAVKFSSVAFNGSLTLVKQLANYTIGPSAPPQTECEVSTMGALVGIKVRIWTLNSLAPTPLPACLPVWVLEKVRF